MNRKDRKKKPLDWNRVSDARIEAEELWDALVRFDCPSGTTNLLKFGQKGLLRDANRHLEEAAMALSLAVDALTKLEEREEERETRAYR